MRWRGLSYVKFLILNMHWAENLKIKYKLFFDLINQTQLQLITTEVSVCNSLLNYIQTFQQQFRILMLQNIF